MTVEQIAIRQEIRQMLGEAGINKSTLKEMVKSVLAEEIEKACKQAFHEKDMDGIISQKINGQFAKIIKDATKESIRERTTSIFNRMIISVDITDENGTSSISR